MKKIIVLLLSLTAFVVQAQTFPVNNLTASGYMTGVGNITTTGGQFIGAGTGLTGTAASLNIGGSAGSVTTIPNLSGVITSVGNITSTGAQTGAGNTFAMSVSPAFTGTPTAPTAAANASNTQIASTAMVQSAIALSESTIPLNLGSNGGGIYSFAGKGSGAVIVVTASGGSVASILSIATAGSGYAVGDLINLDESGSNNDAVIRVKTLSGSGIATAELLYGGTGYSTGGSISSNPLLVIPFFTLTTTGTLTSNAVWLVPTGSYLTTSSQGLFNNNTTGAFTTTVKMATNTSTPIGTGIVIPQGTNSNCGTLLQQDGVNDVWVMSPPPYACPAQPSGLFYQSAGALVHRFNDRIFMGAATINDGNTWSSTPGAGGNQDYVSINIPQGPSTALSQFASLSTVGGIGGMFGTRSSDGAGSGAEGTLAASHVAINDYTTVPVIAEAGYFEAQKKTNAGITTTVEIDSVNQGAFVNWTPYNELFSASAGYTFGLSLAAGGARSGVTTSSAAMTIVDNGAAWNKGIVFNNNALDSNNEAISFYQNNLMKWYTSSSQSFATSASASIGLPTVNFTAGSFVPYVGLVITSSDGTSTFAANTFVAAVNSSTQVTMSTNAIKNSSGLTLSGIEPFPTTTIQSTDSSSNQDGILFENAGVVIGIAPSTNGGANSVGGLFVPNAANAVNYVSIGGAITGISPTIAAAGATTNLGLVLNGQGTGGILAKGTGTNNSQTAGYVGEFPTPTNLTAVSLTTGTAANASSMPLTAGAWDVQCVGVFIPNTTTTATYFSVGVNSVSATFGGFGTYTDNVGAMAAGLGQDPSYASPVNRILLASTTTEYCVVSSGFAVSTMSANGYLRATRVY